MSAGDQVFGWREHLLPNGHPQRGDVVISRLSRPPGRFAMGVSPRPPQLLCRSYEEALGRALRFARRRGVAVWRLEETDRLVLIAQYGPAAEIDDCDTSHGCPDHRQRR